MKFLIMIQSNAASAAKLAELDEAGRREFARAHRRFGETLIESGELIVSEGLADQSTAKRVLVRDGVTSTTDGPFAEVKEQLAGFYLVDCEGFERALELAARVPDAVLGMVEVRPVLDTRGLEM